MELSVTGSSHATAKTTIKKGVYDATFGEDFYFSLDTDKSRRVAGAQELILTVMDWDRVGQNDHIGSVRIVLGDGHVAGTNYLRGGQQMEYPVLSPSGARVVGNDKQVACYGG